MNHQVIIINPDVFKWITLIVVAVLVTVSLSSAIPVVTPPSVITPGSNQNVDSSTSFSKPDTSNSVNEQFTPSSLELPENEAKEGRVEGSNLPETDETTQLISNEDLGIDTLDSNAQSWERKWGNSKTQYWSGTKKWDQYVVITSSGSTWKIKLTAPKNNLDLYIYRYYNSAYRLIAKKTTSSSNEYYDFKPPIKGKNYYLFRAKRAGGTVGTYKASMNLYVLQTSTSPTNSGIASEIFSQINSKRTSNGRSALTRDSYLNSLAQTHANYMAQKQMISHDNNGYRWQQMQNNGYTAYGENVANGISGNVYASCNGPLLSVPNTNAGIAKLMVDMWFTYDSCQNWGHKINILNSIYNRTGIGVAKGTNGYYYACQIFGRI